METVENLLLEQKVRFLACDILFKGAPQSFEEVCQNCRLFTVTPAELLSFTFVPIKFGNCLATALFIPFPGSLYVTQAYCQEIGRKSILTPFSLYQNQGGKWLRNVAPLPPALPSLDKSNISSRKVNGEANRCQALKVDRATPALSPPPLGVPHVSQCPSGEAVFTHVSTTDRETLAPSNVSNGPVNGGSVCQARKVDEATSLFASTPRGSVEFSTSPSNCDSAFSQGPTKDGVVHQAHELGHQGILNQNEKTISSSCQLQKAGGGTPVLGPSAAGEKSTPRRGRRPRAAQKVETRTEVPKKEMESESTQKSGLSSCVTRSATAQLPRRGLETAQTKRERKCLKTKGDKESPENNKRGRKKALSPPVSVKEEIVEVGFTTPTQQSIQPMVRSVFGCLEQIEVVGETRVCLSGAEISGAMDVEDLPRKTEAESGPKRKKGRRKSNLWMKKQTRKASMQSGRGKAVMVNPSPEGTSPTSGRLGGKPVHEALPVMGGSVHVEDGETRISSPAAAELQCPGNAITNEQVFAGEFNQPFVDSYPDLDFGVGKDTDILCRNRESPDPEKPTAFDIDYLLYVSDSEENLDTPELAFADVEPRALPPRLSPALLAAGRRSLDIQRVQLQTVRSLDYEVNHPMAEEAPETEVVSRTCTLEHLSCINELLREMHTIITSSATEHIEDVWTTGSSHCDGVNMNVTVSKVEHCASFPCAEVPEGANLDQHLGSFVDSGDISSGMKNRPVVEVEHCGKSHLSMNSECVHYDDDDNAAVVENSPLMPVDRCEAFCDVGEDTVISVEPGEEAKEVINPVILNTERNGPNTSGASLAAVEKKLVSGVKLLKYDCINRENLVTGTEFREEQLEPFANSRPGVRDNINKGDNLVGAETLPSLEAHEQLEVVDCLPERSEDVKEEAISIEGSETSSHSTLERTPNVQAEQFVIRLATEEETIHSSSLKNTLAVVLEVPDVMTDHVQRVEDANPSRTAVLVGSNAVSQSVPIMNGAEIGANTKTEEGPCSREVALVEVDHLSKLSGIEGQTVLYVDACASFHESSKFKYAVTGLPSEDTGRFAGAEKPAVQVENCANLLSEEFDNVTALKLLDNTGKESILEKEPPILELEPPVYATTEGTRVRKSEKVHPGSKTGPSPVWNAEEPSCKELPALEKIAPANLIKIIDPQSKQKNQEFKIVPEFDNYTVVGEEGSGGYGTVYRVMNNATKRIYAMKCPLMKTHPSCVDNEISMLHQLGGKECVIKFERVIPGRFRTLSDSGEKLSECKSILLEFMEHDKPEVLKKEITVEELRNYCVCLFRALAHMHRLRIMHLDVKPGNFLFSRTRKRGYLVDFNLARDEQKHPKRTKKVLPSSAHIISRIDSTRRSGKRPPVQDVASTPVSFSKRSRLLIGASGTQLSFGTPSPAKTLPILQDQSEQNVAHGVSADTKVSSPRLPDLAQSKSTTPMGAHSMRAVESPKPRNEHPDPGARRHLEVAADVQENHTLGPRPQSGHRAILKYIQTNVYKQQPSVLNQQQSSLPASQRKRVAAVQSKKRPLADGRVKEIQHALQPPIARRPKAPAKLKGLNDQVLKDGPCVGTKGYRAPEVLLRSLKQTTKVDIWSAGVSLLQLVSGRSPFPSTSTDGALKDIAKVRGSDKVLALATRHQRQHSISKELCAMRYPTITLKEWCEKHSKRPELKGRVPPELYDLLEKCLDVDPVSRITAEEALRHQFCSTLDKES